MARLNRTFTLAAVALPLLFLAASGLARASTITVDTIGSGHVAGHCSLEDAVVAANTQATPGGSTCAAGTLNDDTIEFSVNGTIAIAATMNVTDAQLEIDGPALGISISGSSTTQIMTTAALTSLTLTNLTLTRGLTGSLAGGGAIFALGSLTITGCTFSNNLSPTGFGGAISAGTAGSPATITGSSFSTNQAQSGGAVSYASRPIAFASVMPLTPVPTVLIGLTISNSTFTGNTATQEGGAISLGTSTILLTSQEPPVTPPLPFESSITGSTFSANTSHLGGAIFFGGAATPPPSSSAPPTTLPPGGELAIINSTLTGNRATFGGGIAVGSAFTTGSTISAPLIANALLTVTNTTFWKNTATGVSGGADLGALDASVETSLRGSILANSTAGVHCAFGIPAELIDLGYNISDDGSCNFTSPSVNNSTTVFLDPTGLHGNGGPTDTIALEPNSQAVDFIPVADCVDQSSPTPLPLTLDQRGYPRPDAGNPNFCDSGAFELQTPPAFAVYNERVQIARSSAPNSDEVNIGMTFAELGIPTCEAGQDALNDGFDLSLYEGTCAALPTSGLALTLDPFVVHTVNHQSYGTLFQSFPPETVSARMVALPTPMDACGEWTLNLQVAGLDTPALGLGGGNPFALVLSDLNLHAWACFDINNAITGNQIPTPGHGVRRGVRRGR